MQSPLSFTRPDAIHCILGRHIGSWDLHVSFRSLRLVCAGAEVFNRVLPHALNNCLGRITKHTRQDQTATRYLVNGEHLKYQLQTGPFPPSQQHNRTKQCHQDEQTTVHCTRSLFCRFHCGVLSVGGVHMRRGMSSELSALC